MGRQVVCSSRPAVVTSASSFVFALIQQCRKQKIKREWRDDKENVGQKTKRNSCSFGPIFTRWTIAFQTWRDFIVNNTKYYTFRWVSTLAWLLCVLKLIMHSEGFELWLGFNGINKSNFPMKERTHQCKKFHQHHFIKSIAVTFSFS